MSENRVGWMVASVNSCIRPLGRPDQATGIGSQVDDQSRLRQQYEEPDQLVDEGVVIIDIEGPDCAGNPPWG